MKKQENPLWKKNLPLFVILLCVGIIFLAAAEYHSNKESQRDQNDFDEETYTRRLEERLCAMIEKMDGVSDVKVMITLESGNRYRYVRDGASSSSGGDGAVGAFMMNQNDSSPVLLEIKAPKIKGVSVVCRGADNILIREKILGLVAGTLDLTQNKIFVTE